MSKKVSIVLVGIGGYGNTYVNALLDYKGDRQFEIVGVVDPKPESCRRFNEIREMKIPVFSTLEDFFRHTKADLAVISSPIQYHCPQTCLALYHGSNVLCEKPAAATIQEVLKMIDVRNETGKFVSIGYQWSYSQAIQDLKKDIQNGAFGKPRRLKTIIMWPRNADYYKRGWAAKKKDADGNWILDSVANNATAHYLHNMFYVLGKETGQSARPAKVTAELYRANDIENFDTAVIRAYTEEGVELLFFATHATKELLNPVFEYQFDKATIVYGTPHCQDNNSIVALFTDGTKKVYGDPFKDVHNKLWKAIEAVAGRETIVCGLEAASSQTICINGAQESMPDIENFPKDIIRKEGTPELTWVEGLSDALKECYANWLLPSEAGFFWAKSGKDVDLKGYRCFKGENM